LQVNPVIRGRWIFSAWKHLRRYEAGEHLSYFYAIRQTGRASDFLARIRLTERVHGTKMIEALGIAAGIPPQELRTSILPALEEARAVNVDWAADGAPLEVREFSTTEDDVMRHSAAIWERFGPSPVERAALVSLELASSLPLTEVELLSRLRHETVTDEEARQALELANAFSLVQVRDVGDLNARLYYNPYLFGKNIQRASKALVALKADQRESLRSLLEEVQTNQGLPMRSVTSARPELVTYAGRLGLVDTTLVHTSDGRREGFLFTNHFYGYGLGVSDIPDELDHRKLVISSFTYGSRFSLKYKLTNPIRFLEVLISAGYAGKATPIGTDYPLIEKQRIVEVEQIAGDPYGRFRFHAIKKDVLRESLDVMMHGNLLVPTIGKVEDVTGLWVPTAFEDPVRRRAELAKLPEPTPGTDAALLAAIRESAHEMIR
jgi:hypothetical protein